MHMSENTIGIIAGVLTSASMLPQFVKVVRKRDSENLSPWMLIVLIAGVSLWTYYGILKEAWPITLSNGFSVILNVSLLVCWFLFRNKKMG